MTAASATFRYVQRQVLDCLEPNGAKLKTVIRVPLAPGFTGGVGLNYGTSRVKGWIEVHPILGVEHKATEDLLSSWTGRRPFWATWSYPLYALAPDVPRIWAFEPPVDEQHVSMLCEAIRAKGLPILQSSASLEAIEEHLAAGHGNGIEWRLPIVLGMLGRGADALAAATANLKRSHPGTPYDVEYRSFVQSLESWLATDS